MALGRPAFFAGVMPGSVWLVLSRNEGIIGPYIPFKGLYGALTPSFPTKNQGILRESMRCCEAACSLITVTPLLEM